MKSSALASVGRPLWRLLEANNVDADALFRRCGLDPALIQESRTRYPFDSLCNALTEASVIMGSKNVGLEMSTHFTPLDMNALGVTFLSSANLLEAFQRLDRYETLINSSVDFSVEENGARLDLLTELEGVPNEALQFLEDNRIATLVNLARIGLKQSLDPVEVAFTYPEPESTGEHFGMFRCPLSFSQPVSRISFSMADAKSPFADANRELAISNDRFLDEIMNELNSSDLVTQVKRAIIGDLPSGAPNEEDIAKRVFVSSRTLQRRLADEDTSFRTLLLEVRRELAEKYISDKNMPLAEISYMLGFADTSSFSRAFKKWTGEPPNTFRQNLSS